MGGAGGDASWGAAEANLSGQVLRSAPPSLCPASLLRTAEPSLTSGCWDLFGFYFISDGWQEGNAVQMTLEWNQCA